MKRPFRIYDSNTKKNLPWRCYVHFNNAHIGALIQARWASIGTTLEVIDTEGGAFGSYKRGVNGITFAKLKEAA